MSAFERREARIVELDLDKCANTYGSAPCTATGSAGSECYNCWATCQDKANFVTGTKTWSFGNPGAPVPAGQQVRPYIEKLDESPTEIDLEAGLARRGTVTITLADDPCSDIEADPYHATRSAPAGGSFWPRLLARNPNYGNRALRIKTAYFTAGWDAAQFTTERYAVERIEGPDENDRVKLVAKDPVKLADRATVPAPSKGKLAADISAAATSIALEDGDGAGYDDSGFVRIGEEVIEYATREVAQGWSFNNSLDGWTGTGLTATPQTHSLLIESTGANPVVTSPGSLTITGGTNRYVAVRIKRVAGSGWDGFCAYTTAGHGFSASYYKAITDPTVTGEWVVAVWDMHDLTAGGDDWRDGEITQLRFELGNTATDDFEIGWVAYGFPAPSAADLLVCADAAGRGKFNTTAADHGAGEAVQVAKVYQAARVWQVLEDLALAAGLAAGDIDSTGFESEDDSWLGASFAIDAEITEPEKVSDLLREILTQIGAVMWWSPTDQKLKMEVVAPRAPNEAAVLSITEAGHIVERSTKVERLDDLRITVRGLLYDPASATADLGEGVSYLNGEVIVDGEAEGATEYGDSRVDIEQSRWWSASNRAAVFAMVGRRLGRYRDAPQRITLKLDVKDANIAVGDLVDLSLRQIVGFDGNPATVRAIVTRRKAADGRIELRLRATNLGQRYAFWAPAGTGDYPNDPDYAHWAPDENGFASDGSRPYIFF